jgi:hypothetical protein
VLVRFRIHKPTVRGNAVWSVHLAALAPWAGALWVIMDNLDVAIVEGNSEANWLHQHYAVFRLSMLSAVGLFDGKKIIPGDIQAKVSLVEPSRMNLKVSFQGWTD